MKIIVAGSRGIADFETVEEAIEDAIEEWEVEPSVIVSGGANGVDTSGEKWAYENSVPVMPFDVTDEMYDEYGKYAPKKRNELMAEYADALVAVWDGQSNGTENMIELAEDNGLQVFKAVEPQGVTLSDFE